MPELPEVEILKRSLNKSIKSKKIIKININNPNLRYKVQKNFKKILKKKVISKVSRVSKYLILHFSSNKKKLLIHLGMSGTIHLVIEKSKINTNASFYKLSNLPLKHNHIIFFLNNKIKLVYNDPRRFGYMKILDTNFMKYKPLNKLGPDPFSSKFNLIYFKKYIKNKKKKVKNLLMDQKFVSGLGNIYVNEVLFSCKINPSKSILNLSEKNIKDIIKKTKKILKKAILFGGSSIRDFKKIDGKSGNFQQKFMVYGKNNKNCPRNNCEGLLKKIFLSNRSVFFCPICQI